MKTLLNIEPSGFRKGEYVGYGDGVWRITRWTTHLWRAQRPDRPEVLTGTLEEISKQLTALCEGKKGWL